MRTTLPRCDQGPAPARETSSDRSPSVTKGAPCRRIPGASRNACCCPLSAAGRRCAPPCQRVMSRLSSPRTTAVELCRPPPAPNSSDRPAGSCRNPDRAPRPAGRPARPHRPWVRRPLDRTVALRRHVAQSPRRSVTSRLPSGRNRFPRDGPGPARQSRPGPAPLGVDHLVQGGGGRCDGQHRGAKCETARVILEHGCLPLFLARRFARGTPEANFSRRSWFRPHVFVIRACIERRVRVRAMRSEPNGAARRVCRRPRAADLVPLARDNGLEARPSVASARPHG